MTNPATGAGPSITVAPLTDGVPVRLRVRGWNGQLINPALGDVHDAQGIPTNRIWGPWSALSDTVTPVAAATRTTGIARLGLSAISTPGTRTSHQIVLRARKLNAAHTATIRAQLYEGASARSTEKESGGLTTSLADYTLALTDAEAAAISSYGSLELRVRGYSSTGDAAQFEISEERLEVPTAGATGMLRLHASGSQILTPGGNPVVLRGVNIMEAEYNNATTWEAQSIPWLHSNWKGNVVLHGYASAPVLANNSTYMANLDAYVSLTKANQCYCIFAFRSEPQNGGGNGSQLSGVLTTNAINSLAALAARYVNEAHVMLKIQVEPNNVTWAADRPLFEQAVDAIRAQAPNMMVFIPGIAFGQDISGWTSDPVNRSNVVLAPHVYRVPGNWAHDWQFAVTAGLPVWIGEYGPQSPNATQADVQTFLNYCASHNVGHAAWGYEPDAAAEQRLIDASLAPFGTNGPMVRTNMLSTPALPSS